MYSKRGENRFLQQQEPSREPVMACRCRPGKSKLDESCFPPSFTSSRSTMSQAKPSKDKDSPGASSSTQVTFVRVAETGADPPHV